MTVDEYLADKASPEITASQIAERFAEERPASAVATAILAPIVEATLSIIEKHRPAHSPLGASGAERWMNCVGSVTLLKHLGEDISDEPDYRREGVAMHEGAAHALVKDLDAWELVGMEFNATPMTPELCDPIQIYLDYCRSLKGTRYVEYAISSPVHPQFYGTLDFGCRGVTFEVVDLKGGQGVMVEVENNPQIKYYAFGLIDGLERQYGYEILADKVVGLTIIQPRGFHADGPVRRWETTVGEIKAWVHGDLVPAMHATEYDDSLDVGEWCRFCPAKLVCPMLTALYQAAALANPKLLPDYSDEAIGQNFKLAAGVKHYIKALELEAYNRAMRGRAILNGKLVHQKANRVWKEGAAELARERFGDDAWTMPEMKSPAEMEKIPAAKEWVKEFAYTPTTGLKFVLETATGQAVQVTAPADRFAQVTTEDW